ncbi:MAG: hypothetical protein RM347_019760 [Nostoc sp. ChiQUE02]|uniref:hypothetical protein n=1 Tax=Nostoc sp. ChiQUE02 TaxID=3075377 RepID=UPI002AD3129B|nr:hypothetical protein [Nostoc sp. ChiQUE02]MDZ8231530.1 hypothetical protein [Nostoc sp. ChiQUE02]
MPRLTVPPNFIGTSGIDSLVAQESNASVAIGINILNPGVISTFSGNDSITGTGTGTVNLKTSKAGTGIGINNSGTLNAGSGSDTITGTGIGGSFSNNIGTAIIGSSLGEATAGGIAYGIYGQGIIKTGDGNDKIIATSNIDKVQQKVTIGGGIRFELGTGNDYFKGFGSAIVDGGNGFDTLDVKAFKRSEVSVSGVISGNSLNPANITFNNNGNLITLLTTGFENFIFADSSFSYSNLT